MQIYILRDGQESGPLDEATARGLLARGEVKPGDFAWSPGLPEWIPLSKVLAGKPPAAAAATLPEKPAQKAEPATPKQKALLGFLGIALTNDLTRDRAARLVNDAMENPQTAERLTQWNEERLRLHPDLFADEIQAKKENRASHYFELCQSVGGEFFSGVTKAHCQVLVGFLDVKFPHWDAREADAAERYFFPAVAEKFPQLVNKPWRGRLHYAEGTKVASEKIRKSPTASLRQSGTSPLVAISRGLVLGLLILGGLYLTHRTMQSNTTAAVTTAPASESGPPAVVPPSPAVQDAGATAAGTPPNLPSSEPLPPVAPAPPSSSGVNPAPTAADSAGPAVPAMPGTEPPVPVPPPPAILPSAALLPGQPPEAAAIPPLSPAELSPTLHPATAAKTNLLLTKPIEVQLPYGKVTLPPGTAVKLVSRQGAALTVSYQNSLMIVPASSTDAE